MFYVGNDMTLLGSKLRCLRRWPPSNPDPVASEWPSPLVDIVVLVWRPKSKLICVEVQPTIQDSHGVCMLDQGTSDQRLHHVLVRGDQPILTGRMTIDRHVLLRSECVDIVDGVLLARRNVYTAAVI